MELQIFVPLSDRILEYLGELKQSLYNEFGLETSPPREVELLRVPIKTQSESTVVKIVKKALDDKEFKIRFVTKHNTDQISLSNEKVEISIDERTWNQIVDFQKPLLDQIEHYIDTENPIIVQGDTHHSERPKEYVRKYGSDKVLNWWGASILLGKEPDRERRREIYRFITEKHPLDVKMKGKARVRIV